jgi:hypothetical protein
MSDSLKPDVHHHTTSDDLDYFLCSCGVSICPSISLDKKCGCTLSVHHQGPHCNTQTGVFWEDQDQDNNEQHPRSSSSCFDI